MFIIWIVALSLDNCRSPLGCLLVSTRSPTHSFTLSISLSLSLPHTNTLNPVRFVQFLVYNPPISIQHWIKVQHEYFIVEYTTRKSFSLLTTQTNGQSIFNEWQRFLSIFNENAFFVGRLFHFLCARHKQK